MTTRPADPGALFTDLLPWLLGLVGLVVLGGIVIYAIRQRMQGGGAGAAEPFTLQDLRQLHARGELSTEEFERAKASMIGRVSGASKTAAGERAATREREFASDPPGSADDGTSE